MRWVFLFVFFFLELFIHGDVISRDFCRRVFLLVLRVDFIL